MAILGAVALLLRLPGVNAGLWLDEIATLASFVQLPLGEIVTSYQSPNNHVLYSVLSHLSIGVFGDAPWVARLPAVLFGAATAPAMYYLARAWISRREAIAVSVIVAVSYHHIYFSQNARGYTGFVFLTVLATGLLVRALRGGGRGYWAGFAILSALNVYVLLSGLFAVVSIVCGALVLHVLPAKDGRERVRRLGVLTRWTAVAAGLTLLLYAPLLGQMFRFYTTAEADVGWLPSQNLLGVVLDAALPTRNVAVLLAGALVGVPVVASGVVRVARRAPLAFFAFLAPPVIELGVALLLGAGSYPRRFLLVLPLAAMIGVTGVHVMAEWVATRWRAGWVGPAVFGVGVAVGVVAVAAQLGRLYSLPKQDFVGALEWVSERRTPEDIVAGAYVADGALRFHDSSVRSARTVEDLETILQEGRRVWLLGTLTGDMARRAPELRATIETRFVERARFPGLVGDGTVLVWESVP